MAIIQLRRGTAAQWTAANTVLAAGELGLETDTNKIKVGDGVVAWNTLDYNVSSGSTVADITVGADAAPSGTGGVAYDGATGTITYTPPDVGSLETVTSLSLAANTLTYTDESGATTDLDLSLYLDDTNLARLISGVMDPVSRIATFTRDDGSTFEVDFSAVLHDIFAISIGADDSTLHEIKTRESFLILGGTNITTSSDTEGNITIEGPDLSSYLTAETDPFFSAHTTANITDGTGFLINDGAGNWAYDSNTYLTSFTETNDLTAAVTWANVPDANITETSVTQHQAALSITESQISDLQAYLLTETNDLTAAVTWANVPDANITETSVTQHQAALSITESQISDLQAYLLDITNENIETLSNVTITSVVDKQALIYDSATSQWVNGTNGNDVYLVDGGRADSIYTSGDLVLDGGGA